jgi:hypothetical protein
MEEKKFNRRRKNSLDRSRKSFTLNVKNENMNLLLGAFKLKRSANSIALDGTQRSAYYQREFLHEQCQVLLKN